MRLLTRDDSGELCVTNDLPDTDVQPYAILSHTWGADGEEVTFQEIGSGPSRAKPGYDKIKFCQEQAEEDELRYFWVDTCCIDKTNHVELSKAITCMYRWYQSAQVCYVYLADVSYGSSESEGDIDGRSTEPSWEPSFRKSRWFTRGWTLQELLAPKEVIFYSKECRVLGSRDSLKSLLHDVTSIPVLALSGQSLSQFTVTERMRWAQGRTTKETEDRAYCLLGIFNIFMPLIYGEGDNAFVRLTEEINKTHKSTFTLKVADGATFDSYSQAQKGCHAATRIELLQSINDWVRDEKGKNIFWLNGMAGTGKSTISWTVARRLADLGASEAVALGASFFFKRGEGDRASAALLFPTIASQLANSINRFDIFLAQAVKADPQICNKSLSEQFERLICKPLQQLGTSVSRWTYVVVLDALDECENERDIRAVLQLWSSLPVTNSIHLRLFLTSRPELVIRLGFKRMSTSMHHDLVLHEVPEPIMHHDILAYLTDALIVVRNDYNFMLDDDLVDDLLPVDWPGSSALQMLTSMSIPLFIVAATIYRLISRAERPQQYLNTILHSRKNVHLSQMGSVYMLVLQAMTTSLLDVDEISKAHRDFRTIVGAIVLLAEPLSRNALATLLGMKSSEIHLRLLTLHAVLQIPTDGNALIRPLHLSFGEYLTSSEIKDTPYWIDAVATHKFLGQQCLALLSGPTGLRENMCRLSYPGQFRSEVPLAQINEYIPSALAYACSYWVHHIRLSNSHVCDDDGIHVFLRQHFLHLLEALSFMNRLAEVFGFLTILQSILAIDHSSHMEIFLLDARRFLLANRSLGETAPLQLYASAIVFAPQHSIIKCSYGHLPGWILQGPVTPVTWTSELLKLEAHRDHVRSLDFSPDGSLLASSSVDGDTRVWRVETGQEIWKLRGVKAGFSLDGSVLATAQIGGPTGLWNVETGQDVQELEYSTAANTVSYPPDPSTKAKIIYGKIAELWSTGGYSGYGLVNGVFSSDGSLFVSASSGHVDLWDVKTSHTISAFKGTEVAFSHDSSLLVVTLDTILRLFNPKTGQMIKKLNGHTNTVISVAFSQNGSLLASGSIDQTVRLWHVSTGKELRVLRGHTDRVSSVTFSSDNSLLGSGSWDSTVRIWDARVDQEEKEQERHTDRVRAVVFSPDYLLFASASRDKTVKLWDTKTGHMVRNFTRHTDWVDAVAFSPDGSLLASGSFDQTIWIQETKTGQVIKKLERVGYLTKLSFSSDYSGLVTDKGFIKVAMTSSSPSISVPVKSCGLTIGYDWIRSGEKRILWLPQEYRGGISTIAGELIGIGGLDGRVSILRIKYP